MLYESNIVDYKLKVKIFFEPSLEISSLGSLIYFLTSRSYLCILISIKFIVLT